MSEVLEIIDAYINKQNTNYAILINGEWGSGKTFFIQNTLKSHIEKKEGINNKSKKLVYISLNGLTKIDEIAEQAVLGKLNASKVIKSGYGVVKSAVNIIDTLPIGSAKLVNKALNISAAEFRKNVPHLLDFSNCVIVIDDLERISQTIKIHDVLGYINTNFVEHQNTKLIFVSNIKKIFELHGANSEFSKIQEKLIDRAIEFKQDLNITLLEYASTFLSKLGDSEALKYIKEDYSEIIKMLNVAKCNNFRTIRFCLENFAEIYKYFNLNEVSPVIKRAIFMFNLSISQEYKNGNLTEIKKELKRCETGTLRQSIENKIKEKNYPQGLTYEEKFYDTYILNNSIEWSYYESIYGFVLTGILDKELFSKELSYRTRTIEEWEVEKNKLEAYRDLEEKELQSAVTNVLIYSQQGKYRPSQYLWINNILRELFNKTYISLPKDFYEKLIEGLNKALLNHPLHVNAYEEPDSIQLPKENGERSELTEIIRSSVKKNAEVFIQSQIDEFYEVLEKGSFEEFLYFCRRLEIKDNFFVNVKAEDFTEVITKISNRSIGNLIGMLSQNYLKISNAGQYNFKEKDTFYKTAAFLEKYIQHNKLHALRKDNLSRLADIFKACADHLENSK